MREITIDGVTYDSVSAAARALDINPKKLRLYLDLEPANFRGPVTIRGITYPSVAAAARAIRISPTTIHEARKAGRLDTVGLDRNRPRHNADHRSKYAKVIPMIAPLAKSGLPASKIAKQIGMCTALVVHYASRDGIELVPGRRQA